MVTQLAAVTAATVGVQQSLAAAFERGNAEKRLQNLTSSTAEYEQALRLAKISSQEFGTTQTEATKALGDVYSRLSGVGYGLTEVSEIYKGFNVIAAQSGVATEDAAGAFLQLSQALGSGKLQGDELRSILERMPQLAQAIAAEMGIAAGEVRQAGADGKITGDVMYAALKKASEGSFDLSKTLTGQQATMNEVKQRAEELQVALGEALAPVFLSAMNTLGEYALVTANAFKKLNEWASANAESIQKVVSIGLEIAKIAASVMIVIKAYALWQKAVAGVAAAKAALLAMSGVGALKIAAGVTASVGAYALLTNTIEGVEGAVAGLEAESKKELATTKQLAAENENLYRTKAEGASKAVDNTKAIEAAQKEVTNSIKETIAALDEQQSAQESIASAAYDIAVQRNKVEQAITGTMLEQAQAQLDNAKTQAERIKYAEEVYDLTVKQAEIEAGTAQLAVNESVRKVEAQLAYLQLKEKEIAAEVALARARGIANEQHTKALELARASVAEASIQLELRRELAVLQNQEIQALLKGKINTAEMAYQQNLVAKSTGEAAASAGTFAGNMGKAAAQAERAAAAAQQAAAAMGGGGGSKPWSLGQTKTTVITDTSPGQDQSIVNHVLEQYVGNGAVYRDNGDLGIDFQSMQIQKPGGWQSMKDKIRDAHIAVKKGYLVPDGKGGYIDPHRKEMIEANAAKVAADKERLTVKPANVSINYSGTTFSMNGNDYVSTKDVNGIVQQAVNAMNNNLQRSSKTRLEIGI
jgi:tape measure domain-containing protein